MNIAAILVAVLSTLPVAVGAKRMDQPRVIFSFDSDHDMAAVSAHGAGAERTATGLSVKFQPVEWPSVVMKPGHAVDLHVYCGVAFEVTNPGAESVTFGIRVDDDLSADGTTHSRSANATIEAKKTASFLLPFSASEPMEFGMRGLPRPPGYREVTGWGQVDSHHLVRFHMYLHNPAMPVTLVLRSVRAVPGVSLDGIVDRFGQYAKADWPGEVKDESDLRKRRDEEAADLKAHPGMPGRTGYGGWAKGPVLKATGWFRTQKVNGKWWLVTPDGRLFLSFGADCVNTYASTFTTKRKRMFEWLPSESDPLAKYAGHANGVHSGPVREGDTFDFFRANLDRKYGESFEGQWFDLALTRLKSWGFNTVGNWSDRRLYRNGRMPYVATVGVGGSHARVASGDDYWGKMHDPFDPQFADDVQVALRDVVLKVRDDPWCLGGFVDNELSWGGGGDGRYGLALGALTHDGPAKGAFVDQLRAKYADVAKLNTAWGTSFGTWEAVAKPGVVPNEAMKADMSAFLLEFARKYFSVIREQLKRLDPNHLYLGCRFAWRTPEAVQAAAEICDVVSFNIYARRVDPAEWGFLARLNRPCVIGEFHFGALDRGLFHTGLVPAADQTERAAMYKDYVRSVVDNPALVGCHWFQFVDEPLTGRTFDGENYNIGLLSVTDTPYRELISAARVVHAEAYARRMAGGGG